MRSLYIFVTTDRPDQYLNPIAYWLKEDVSIQRIVFVQINNPLTTQAKANAVCRDVYDLTYQLSQGKYKYYIGNLKGQEVSLDQMYSDSKKLDAIKERYASYLVGSVIWDREIVDYTKLRSYIRSLGRMKEKPIIDISCVSKSYVGDILSCCLLSNFNNLVVFDFLIEPNYSQPWKILIHGLNENIDFRYVNLVKTIIFQENLRAVFIRTTPLIASIAATLLFVVLALIANFVLGNNNAIIQVLSVVSAVLGIVAFVLTFFPLRGT